MTDEKQIAALADFAVKKFGKIDLWVNNAGIWIPHAPIEELQSKRAHEMMEVNLFGTIYGSQAAIMRMYKQGHGSIVNIVSIRALEARAGSAGYGASKCAAAGFTKSLRLEAAPKGVAVFAVHSGRIRTNLFHEKQPENFNELMDPDAVAGKIVDNLKQEHPEEELVIKKE